MQGIYTYIPETNYVLREYSVAAILLLLFMVLIITIIIPQNQFCIWKCNLEVLQRLMMLTVTSWRPAACGNWLCEI